jgi:hypothetical protein
VEAVREAVWKKNRSPMKPLEFDKTPFEAVHGVKPDLTRELPWASRVYVTRPPELSVFKKITKLHAPRGILGYFVSSERETIERIWDPEARKVRRIASYKADMHHGMDDAQHLPIIDDRQLEGSVEGIPGDNNVDSDDDGDVDLYSNAEAPRVTSYHFSALALRLDMDSQATALVHESEFESDYNSDDGRDVLIPDSQATDQVHDPEFESAYGPDDGRDVQPSPSITMPPATPDLIPQTQVKGADDEGSNTPSIEEKAHRHQLE